MRYARIDENAIVAEIIDGFIHPDTQLEVPIAERFTAELADTIHPCGPDVEQGWTRDESGIYYAPAIPAAE